MIREPNVTSAAERRIIFVLPWSRGLECLHRSLERLSSQGAKGTRARKGSPPSSSHASSVFAQSNTSIYPFTERTNQLRSWYTHLIATLRLQLSSTIVGLCFKDSTQNTDTDKLLRFAPGSACPN